MGTYGLIGVIQAWELEKLTTEQAIGQILQIIVGIEGRLRDLEHQHNRLGRLILSSKRTQADDSEGEQES